MHANEGAVGEPEELIAVVGCRAILTDHKIALGLLRRNCHISEVGEGGDSDDPERVGLLDYFQHSIKIPVHIVEYAAGQGLFGSREVAPVALHVALKDSHVVGCGPAKLPKCNLGFDTPIHYGGYSEGEKVERL